MSELYLSPMILYYLFRCHTQWCSGFTFDSIFSDHFWLSLGDYRECCRWNPVWLYLRKVPYSCTISIASLFLPQGQWSGIIPSSRIILAGFRDKCFRCSDGVEDVRKNNKVSLIKSQLEIIV